jgi:phosphoglycerate dehydrogenase-like enzyme
MISVNSSSASCTSSCTDTPVIAFIGNSNSLRLAYSSRQREELSKNATLVDTELDSNNWMKYPEVTRKVDILLSTWGVPKMDHAFLARFPQLKGLFYAAGTVKGFITKEAVDRGIVVCSAAEANALAVAEYTLSTILLSLKNFWGFIRYPGNSPEWPAHFDSTVLGSYHAVIGLISLGSAGSAVARKLAYFDCDVIAYDPFVSKSAAKNMGVKLVSLEDIFRLSDVVSIHTPLIPETVHLITGDLLRLMKPYATFINTSRGAIVNEDDLCEVMRIRPDLTAILDVTWPEPPCEESPLYNLKNVVLTPHIAGSLGREITRMGDWMVDEVKRYLNNAPLHYQVIPERLANMA